MCKALKEIKRDAERKGRKQGEALLGTLMERLLAQGRTEDARLAAVDEAERSRLYRECGIAVK